MTHLEADKPFLSSVVRLQIEAWSWVPQGAQGHGGLTDWLSVLMWLVLWLQTLYRVPLIKGSLCHKSVPVFPYSSLISENWFSIPRIRNWGSLFYRFVGASAAVENLFLSSLKLQVWKDLLLIPINSHLF